MNELRAASVRFDVRQPRNPGHAIFLISGPSGAGKSTVAPLLAGRFSRGAYVDGDFFRRSIISGRHEMTPDASPAALEQLRLRYRLATTAADTYFADGYTVVLEDVIAGPMLPECVALIRARPLHVVVLMPPMDEVAARDAGRETSGYLDWSARQLYDLFARETPRVGLWLDTSGETPDQTVERILAETDVREERHDPM